MLMWRVLLKCILELEKEKKGTVITITIGTGIGSGLFCDGILVPNVELGHMSYKKYKAIEHFAADSARKRENLSYEEWGKRFNKFLKLVTLMVFSRPYHFRRWRF